MQTFNIWIRASMEEGIIWSLDPRSLSWRWGFWPITMSFYRFACFIMRQNAKKKKKKEWRNWEEELKQGFCFCLVFFSLSILCGFLSSSEERLTIFEHFYHVTRADFFSFFLTDNSTAGRLQILIFWIR